MSQRKFAIVHTVGNTETVIRLFDDKDEALAFGEKQFECWPDLDGVIACVQAVYDEQGRHMGNTCRVFEVWQ